MISQLLALVLLPALNDAQPADRAEIEKAIIVLRNVTPDHQEGAARAWKQLAAAPADQLPLLLAGMDGATPVARNWLRSSIDQVLDDAQKKKKTLPYPELELFIRDRTHDPQARRLAYELVAEHDKTTTDRFLPDMFDDPSPELRRDAVARVLEQGEKVLDGANKKDALPIFQKALASARDIYQINKAARRMR
ncbi:MAG TPA: hypothetical protein VGP68_02385, partial [Gemmataceae bacterium]|nr:hypothetical protein [Gemmataceae bacterium]